MLHTIILFLFAAMSDQHAGDPGLKPVHPDEPADYTYNERFSSKNSLESLESIKSALDSFRKLTGKASGKISKEALDEIGNTDSEMQILGFVNLVQAIKGTLLKQEYLIKKLTYELAQRKSKSGEVTQSELSKIQSEYKKAEKEFKDFWEAFGIAD